jgi:hypothetical protein
MTFTITTTIGIVISLTPNKQMHVDLNQLPRWRIVNNENNQTMTTDTVHTVVVSAAAISVVGEEPDA